VALYGGSSMGGSCTRGRWFSSFSGSPVRAMPLGVAGALVSIAAAASLSDEVHAKEPPPPELVPKEVVLYQYEACPFCNKVKSKDHLFYFSFLNYLIKLIFFFLF
jgi:microsomal prostaglandin-E synthase 2